MTSASSTGPPYTLVNRDSNWKLMNTNGNYQSRLIPTTGGILVSDANGKNITTITTPTGLLRANPM